MIEIVGTEFYQWDTGRSVMVANTGVSCVHFANTGDSKAVIMDIIDSTAKVPDYLLQTGKQLCVYAVNNGVTVEKKIFPVRKRERPENYVYEDDQRNYIYALIRSAEEATGEAIRATKVADVVTAAANTAANNANAATANATAAAVNADNAASFANTATDNANDAINDARNVIAETNTVRENIQKTASEVLSSLSDVVYAPPIVCSASGDAVTVNDASNQLLRGLTLYGKTTQNGTPTPENPVPMESAGASGSITVTVATKNLSRLNNVELTGSPMNEVLLEAPLPLPVTVSWMQDNYRRSQALFTYVVNGETYYNHGSDMGDGSFVINGTGVLEKVVLTNVGSITASITNIQIELGAKKTTYEPSVLQTFTTSTPNGLAGIPVTERANYTDTNGQQYISSYRDFGAGVDVHKVGAVDMGTLEWKNTTNEFGTIVQFFQAVIPDMINKGSLGAMCPIYKVAPWAEFSTGDKVMIAGVINVTRTINIRDSDYTDAESLKASLNGVMLLYELENPIETAIPAEELAQYATLQTNKLNTVVFNDSNAGMKLEYVVDTKTYIDQKIAAISAAMLNT